MFFQLITKPVNLRLILGVRTFKTHNWRKAKETKKSAQQNLEKQKLRSKEKVHTGSYTEVNPNLFLHKLEQYSDRGGYRLAAGRPHEFGERSELPTKNFFESLGRIPLTIIYAEFFH